MCSCVFGITPYVTDNTGNTPLFLRPQLVLHRECSQCSVVSSGLARTLQNTWQPGNHDNHGVSTLRKKIRIWQVRNKIPYNIYTHAHAHAHTRTTMWIIGNLSVKVLKLEMGKLKCCSCDFSGIETNEIIKHSVLLSIYIVYPYKYRFRMQIFRGYCSL